MSQENYPPMFSSSTAASIPSSASTVRRRCASSRVDNCAIVFTRAILSGSLGGDELPRIENPLRIESRLQRRVDIAARLVDRLGPPPLLCKADAMFAGDHAAGAQHPREKFI